MLVEFRTDAHTEPRTHARMCTYINLRINFNLGKCDGTSVFLTYLYTMVFIYLFHIIIIIFFQKQSISLILMYVPIYTPVNGTEILDLTVFQ